MNSRRTAKRAELVVPGPAHVCAGCGCNIEYWRYAFAQAYLHLRLTYLGPGGYLGRFPAEQVWRMYEAALAELRLRTTELARQGAFRHRCAA